MCDTNDGFRLAELDLKLRGAGDINGTLQSGMAFDLRSPRPTDRSDATTYYRTVRRRRTDGRSDVT